MLEYNWLHTFVSSVEQKYECMAQQNKTRRRLKKLRNLNIGMIKATFLKQTSSFYIKASWQFIKILVWLFPPNIFKFSIRKIAVTHFVSDFGQWHCQIKASEPAWH